MCNSKLSESFRRLNLTQFLGALNDNLLKLLIIFFLIAQNGPQQATAVSAKCGAVFVIPFLLFSPLAGMLADRLSKQRIIRAMKGLELVIALLGIAAFSSASATGLYAVLFLMAAQSALFGPAKYGIIPELVERRQLSRANSLIESCTYLAIIFGSALAPLLAQASSSHYQRAGLACVAIALFGILSSWRIEKTAPAAIVSNHSAGFLKETWGTIGDLRRDRDLLLAILGSAYFLFLGAFAQINLIPFGMQVHRLTQEQSGYLFLVAALGIGLGSLLAGKLSGRNVEFGVVPLGAFGLAVTSCGLYLLPVGLIGHLILIALLGGSAGLFIVPLQAFVQLRAPREKLGRILAVSGVLSWCGVLFAAGLAFLLGGPLGCSAAQSFFILGLLTFGLTLLTLFILPDFLLRFLALLMMKLAYRLRIHGLENIPAEGPALLVPNHVSWIDALLLIATQQRRIRFVMHRDIFHIRPLRPLFKLMGGIPVSSTDSRRQKLEFIKSARQALDDGYLVCIFAEGMITRNGTLNPFRSGLEAISKGFDYPIIPIFIGGAWGSIFSYAHGKPLSKLPTSFPYPIAIHFGSPLKSGSSASEVQQAVTELSYEYFESRKQQRSSLVEMFISTARRNWTRKAICDSSGKQLSYGRTLTAALALAEQLKSATADQQQIGLLLPPSVGGALANLAVPLLGKIPVNLNYTAAPETVASAINQCEIKTLITSKRFLQRFPQLPLPEQVICLEDLLPQISTSARLRNLFKARLLPTRLLLNTPLQRGAELATIIFSSGSTGEPKGVMLSQHNIISNIEATRMVSTISPKDDVCSALPFFHALGFTATLWLPLLSGFSVSYHFNPMDAGIIVQMVREQASTLLLTTPTFLGCYLRKAEREDFSSLRLVVTGAEKLKPQLAEAFAEKFGIRPLEGYGATELAPLISLNLPDLQLSDVTQIGNRPGSVGRPVPGVLLRVIDPETHQPLTAGESGLILVKGPNLMTGYLNRPDKTAAAIVDGWYHTGDIGRIDRDGFLHITDRLARFSKIGGEMVPHIKVEEIFYQELQLEGNALAVTSIPDPRKGEKLVVVFTEEAGMKEQLLKICKKSGLPNLWRPHPDNFVKVPALPLLGTGKLDLCGLRKLAITLTTF